MSIVASDTQIMRGMNTAAVLRALRSTDATSVARLAGDVGLSRQAVTRSLAGLEAAGLVTIAAAPHSSTGAGRPAQKVSFNASAAHVVTVSLSPGGLCVALADLRGEIVGRRAFDQPLGFATESVIDTEIDALIAEAGIGPDGIWAVTVGVPGIVDLDSGRVRLSSSMPELQKLDLAATLSAKLDCDVLVGNEVRFATEGERWRGASNHFTSMVLIEWGERIGASLVLNNALYRGISNDSGDIGFLDLGFTEEGATPTEGLGPFERAVGAAAIVRQVHSAGVEAVAEDRTPTAALDRVIDAFLDGDQRAVDAIDTVAQRFARGVAAIRALMDPDIVVIGGQMARCGPRLLELLDGALTGQVLNQPRLGLSQLGSEAVIHGGVRRALDLVDESRLTAQALAGFTAVRAHTPRLPGSAGR